MSAKESIAQAVRSTTVACLLGQLLRPPQHYVVALSLLLHGDDHVEHVERVQHDLEVLIVQHLNEEVKEPLRVQHHVQRVNFDALLHVVQDLIDGHRAYSPVVLRIHKLRDLLSRDDLTLGSGT